MWETLPASRQRLSMDLRSTARVAPTAHPATWLWSSFTSSVFAAAVTTAICAAAAVKGAEQRCGGRTVRRVGTHKRGSDSQINGIKLGRSAIDGGPILIRVDSEPASREGGIRLPTRTTPPWRSGRQRPDGRGWPLVPGVWRGGLRDSGTADDGALGTGGVGPLGAGGGRRWSVEGETGVGKSPSDGYRRRVAGDRRRWGWR